MNAERMVTIDMSLKNQFLYDGCQIEEVAGRLNLVTPIPEAIQRVGRNAAAFIDSLSSYHRQECTLTGPMAVWSYLIVFHAVVHVFSRVYYDDGKSGPVLIAAHGPAPAPHGAA